MTKRHKADPIEQKLRDKVLLDSKRRCAICFAESNSREVKEGDVTHIVHIQPKGLNENADNLIFLCANHHAMADRGTLTAEQLRTARGRLYESLKEMANKSFNSNWSPALRYEELACHLLEEMISRTFGSNVNFRRVFDASSSQKIDGVDFSAEIKFHGVGLWIVGEVRYSKALVGPDAVRSLVGAIAAARPNPNKGILVTNMGFTERAIEAARYVNVSLFVLPEDAVEWNPVASQ